MATLPERIEHASIARLSWPIMVSMLSYTAMTIADSIYVGQLGTAPLAAIGLAATVIHLADAFGNGLLSGTRVVIAQETGAGAFERARVAAWQGVWIALAFGVMVAFAAPLGQLVFPWLGASPEVSGQAAIYASFRLLGAPIFFLFTALAVHFQGRGDTRTPMVATVVANAINIVLDPIFIFGFGVVPAGGIAGAAIATLVGMSVGVAILMGAARWGSLALGSPVQLRPAMLRTILRIGVPRGVQYELDVASFAVFAALLAGSGDEQLAAHVVVVRVILVSFLPCHAVGEATSVLVGQRLGAGDRQGAERTHKLATQQAMAIMVGFGIVFISIPEALVAVFGAEPAVSEIASSIVVLYAAVQIFDAIAVVSMGALAGAGDTSFVMKLSVGTAWLIKVPIAVLLVEVAGLGAFGAWLGLAVEIVALSAITLARVRGTSWLSHTNAAPLPAAA